MRWMLLLLVGCSSDPSGPGGSSRVVQKEIALLDGGSTGDACFEVELVDPPECVASFVPDGGDEQVLPWCDQDPTALCWRIEIDLASCPGSASQRARFDNVTAADVGLVTMQCIAVDML